MVLVRWIVGVIIWGIGGWQVASAQSSPEIKIFLDNSWSLQGFFNEKATQENVNLITNDLQNLIPDKEMPTFHCFHSEVDKEILFRDFQQEFKKYLRTKDQKNKPKPDTTLPCQPFLAENNSDLANVFATAESRLGQIAVVITDNVQSITDATEKIYSSCGSGNDTGCVSRSLLELINSGKSLWLLGAKLPFSGTFYPERVDRTDLKNTEPNSDFRPLYFWVIGKEYKATETFVQRLTKILEKHQSQIAPLVLNFSVGSTSYQLQPIPHDNGFFVNPISINNEFQCKFQQSTEIRYNLIANATNRSLGLNSVEIDLKEIATSIPHTRTPETISFSVGCDAQLNIVIQGQWEIHSSPQLSTLLEEWSTATEIVKKAERYYFTEKHFKEIEKQKQIPLLSVDALRPFQGKDYATPEEFIKALQAVPDLERFAQRLSTRLDKRLPGNEKKTEWLIVDKTLNLKDIIQDTITEILKQVQQNPPISQQQILQTLTIKPGP